MNKDILARPGQFLRDHLMEVASRAERFTEVFRSGPWGRACGLLHDIGKASELFQKRVRGETKRGVDHSTFGARHADSAWREGGKLLAYCIAGHHSGLPDGLSNDESCLKRRLDPGRRRIEDASAWRDVLGPRAEIDFPESGRWPFDTRTQGAGFRLTFFLRMVFSCLVDADRLDAEVVGDADRSARRDYPALGELAGRLDRYLAEKQARVEDIPVNRIRTEVLEACRGASNLDPGLFSLTVPTGGGKTLSSLAFALGHALRHGLDRVIYVIPYTSIIEQNAGVFREALGDADGSFVVEHHSNLVPNDEADDDRPHPATENWDAPVIVTTAVQFFESLFAARAGRCRKLHNIARSVVILDEAQMLPLPYLRPCLEALRELAATYGSSVVLCTATQPALNAPDDPDQEGFKDGLENVREIMSDPVNLHRRLKRVEVTHLGEVTDADLAARLASEPQVLCIVPTRRMARRLYDALRESVDPGGLFHLSALMCPLHRSEALDCIRTALLDGRTCRVVSTSLVEAGVDVDFPVVFRAEAGIDSIAQAAGRCNREGRTERGRMHVFRPEGGLPAGDFRRMAQAARSVTERHLSDLLHPDAVRDYFLELYWRAGEDQLDAKNILKRLTEDAGRGWFPFKEIEKDFQLMERGTQGLIIPYDDAARRLVRALDALELGQRARGIMRRLQRHTVSLYSPDFERLERDGAIRRAGPGGQFFVLSNENLYNPEVGLDLYRDEPGVYAPEDLIR